MKKENIVSIIAIIAIVATVSYSALNLYGISVLELRGHEKGEFDFYGLTKGKISICNNFPIPVTFNKYDLQMIYKSNNLATFTIPQTTLQPYSSSILDGKLHSEDFEWYLGYLLNLDSEISGMNINTIDATQFYIIANIDSTFLGIPFSHTKEYSGYEFFDLMNQEVNCNVSTSN